MEYILKNKDELVMTAKQLQEFKDIVIKETEQKSFKEFDRILRVLHEYYKNNSYSIPFHVRLVINEFMELVIKHKINPEDIYSDYPLTQEGTKYMEVKTNG